VYSKNGLYHFFVKPKQLILVIGNNAIADLLSVLYYRELSGAGVFKYQIDSTNIFYIAIWMLPVATMAFLTVYLFGQFSRTYGIFISARLPRVKAARFHLKEVLLYYTILQIYFFMQSVVIFKIGGLDLTLADLLIRLFYPYFTFTLAVILLALLIQISIKDAVNTFLLIILALIAVAGSRALSGFAMSGALAYKLFIILFLMSAFVMQYKRTDLQFKIL
jgi:hypothetical protein